MKTITLLSFVFIMLAIGAVSASAQTPTRITFKPGATSAVVTGTLTSLKQHKTFLIRVRKGQTLTTEDAGDNPITVIVEAPPGSTFEQDMAADCHSQNDVSPTAAGDYKITVTECLKADRWRGTFKLRVTVR